MLNGLDPLLVIVLKQKGILDFFGPQSAIASLVPDVGVPIPIYLSERLTGIYVENESRSIDLITTVEPTTNMDARSVGEREVKVTQTAADSHVTVNLLASRDSILLTALIALMDLLLKRAVSAEYELHYLSGPTAIFGALLHRFATSVSRNDDLVRIEMTLSTAAKKTPVPKPPVDPVAKNATTSLKSPPAVAS